MPQNVSPDGVKDMQSSPKFIGADSWRNVTRIEKDGIRYEINSLSMWANLSAKVVEASCDEPFYNSDEADCSRLIVMLHQGDSRVTIGPHRSRRPEPTHDTPFQMTFGTPGVRQYGFFDQPADQVRWLVLQFDVGLLSRHLGAGFEAPDFSPRFMFHDPGLFQLAKLFEAACLGGQVRDALADDILLLALLQNLSRLENRRGEQGHGLSQTQRRLLVDYMRDRLAENIRLSELCNLVQLSPAHFCRCFKRSLGLSPHAWQIRERIRVAQSMLRDGHLRLADIALAVGFYDQAHFSKTFKRIVGATPLEWRRIRYH